MAALPQINFFSPTTGRDEFVYPADPLDLVGDQRQITITNHKVNIAQCKNVTKGVDINTGLPTLIFQMVEGGFITWVFASISDMDNEYSRVTVNV